MCVSVWFDSILKAFLFRNVYDEREHCSNIHQNCTNRIEFMELCFMRVKETIFHVFNSHQHQCCRPHFCFYCTMKGVLVGWLVGWLIGNPLNECTSISSILLDCVKKCGNIKCCLIASWMEPFTNNQFLCYTSIFLFLSIAITQKEIHNQDDARNVLYHSHRRRVQFALIFWC